MMWRQEGLPERHLNPGTRSRCEAVKGMAWRAPSPPLPPCEAGHRHLSPCTERRHAPPNCQGREGSAQVSRWLCRHPGPAGPRGAQQMLGCLRGERMPRQRSSIPCGEQQASPRGLDPMLLSWDGQPATLSGWVQRLQASERACPSSSRPPRLSKGVAPTPSFRPGMSHPPRRLVTVSAPQKRKDRPRREPLGYLLGRPRSQTHGHGAGDPPARPWGGTGTCPICTRSAVPGTPSRHGLARHLGTPPSLAGTPQVPDEVVLHLSSAATL